MSCHDYEGVMSVLCTPLQVKCNLKILPALNPQHNLSIMKRVELTVYDQPEGPSHVFWLCMKTCFHITKDWVLFACERSVQSKYLLMVTPTEHLKRFSLIFMIYILSSYRYKRLNLKSTGTVVLVRITAGFYYLVSVWLDDFRKSPAENSFSFIIWISELQSWEPDPGSVLKSHWTSIISISVGGSSECACVCVCVCVCVSESECVCVCVCVSECVLCLRVSVCVCVCFQDWWVGCGWKSNDLIKSIIILFFGLVLW